jgi:cell division protease FtsH
MLEYETLTGDEIKQLLESGKIDRPDEPRGPVATQPVRGSSIPRAGQKFGGESGGATPQGA